MERTVIEFKHILSPVDFSDSSSRSLDHAVALARWYDSRLTVLHVAPTFEPVPVQGDLGYPMQVVNPVTSEEVVAEMRRHLDGAGVPHDVVLTARAGDASTTIPEEDPTASAHFNVPEVRAICARTQSDGSALSWMQSRAPGVRSRTSSHLDVRIV
jgi:hypothetical protein